MWITSMGNHGAAISQNAGVLVALVATVLLARNYKIQQSNETQSQFIHYITMVPLTDSMQSFSLRCLSPHSLNTILAIIVVLES